MPELPDVTVYVEALRMRLIGHRLKSVALKSPFLLRTADPPLSAAYGQVIVNVSRIGKQIGLRFAGDLWFVLHLKIAGRLHWNIAAPKAGGGKLLAASNSIVVDGYGSRRPARSAAHRCMSCKAKLVSKR